jgi:hypothetical protein
MTPREERQCLSYDPWGWDETPYRLMRDGFVKARKSHGCICCAHTIRAGQRVRARAEIDLDEGKRGTFYWCVQCCEAMARVNDDNGLSIENRTGMGMKRSGQLPWDA